MRREEYYEDEEREELSESIDDFTNHLFQCIAHDRRDNFVISGLNAHCALSMCLLGAKGNTSEEMLRTLKLCSPYALVYWDLMRSFKNVPDVNLNLASKIFGDQTIIVKESFMSSLKRYFNSEMGSVNFNTDPASAVKTVNDWCATKTNNQIQKIMNKNDIHSTTRMILAAVVYFKASWYRLYQMSSWNTTLKPFYINDTKKNVQMMRRSFFYYYKDLNNFDAVSLAIPYKNEDFQFLIIVPKNINGLEALEKKIDEIQINYEDFNYDENRHPINLMLPKFKIDTSIDLRYYFKKMGMIDPFTENANFQGISEKPILDPPLHIDSFCQQAFIDVNEAGTEAAAFSTAVLRGGGATGPPIQFMDVTVDRPFLFKIINTNIKITLFSGRIVDPVY